MQQKLSVHQTSMKSAAQCSHEQQFGAYLPLFVWEVYSVPLAYSVSVAIELWVLWSIYFTCCKDRYVECC